MSNIYIEAKTPEGLLELPQAYHLYLVYRADDGREWVIRGGPAYRADPYSIFAFEINQPIEDSSDHRVSPDGNTLTPANRHSTLLVFDRQTVDETWNLMVKYAYQIEATHPVYDPLGLIEPNSNTFVAALIYGAGREPADSLPTGLDSGGALGVAGYSDYDMILQEVAPPSDGVFRGPVLTSLGIQTAQTIYGGAGGDILKGGWFRYSLGRAGRRPDCVR